MHENLTEIISRSEQGATIPFFCKCDDGFCYYVKGYYAGRKTLISEWLAGKIGHALGLNLPEIRIIDIPPNLSKYCARTDIDDLGTMPVFGSRFVDNSRDFLYTDIDKVNEDDKAKILLFDWWIANGDRILSEFGGNPNLIISSHNDTIWVIDHNLAFQVESLDSFWENHIFAKYISKWNDSFRDIWIPQMESIMSDIDYFWNEMPEEWTQEGELLSLSQVKSILGRMDDTQLNFWRD